MKLPVFNNHTCKGIFNTDCGLPEHFCWIPHIILGMLQHRYKWIMYPFVLYQIIQVVCKGELWDDIIDITEFYIGYILGFYLFRKKTK
jgi:hypothetical protein